MWYGLNFSQSEILKQFFYVYGEISKYCDSNTVEIFIGQYLFLNLSRCLPLSTDIYLQLVLGLDLFIYILENYKT